NLQRHHIRFADPNITVAGIFAKYLAAGVAKAWDIERSKQWLFFFADRIAAQLTRNDARIYRVQRHAAKKVSDTTVNRDLQAIRHLLYWAVDEGLLLSNPFARLPMVRDRRKKRAVLSVQDEQLLLAESASHLRRIVICALDTGMRRGEILHQQWEDIDFGRELLWVSRSKTPEGECREIPLTRRLFALLWELRQDHGPIFTFKDRAITRIKTAWKGAVRRSGIRPLRFHDLRHTFTTRLLEAGVLRETRMAIVGHSTGDDVHSIYSHVELPMKREAIRKLETWVETQLNNSQTERRNA
ncbi:MAG: tyrosine-type recombinase/integrase, partial [Candidatus Korobacteraceae bacterium]